MPTVWGYGRASTNEQEETLLVQRGAIEREYQYRFQPQGYEWGGVLIDKGVSGKVPLRQRLQGMQLQLNSEAGDAIIMTKLDRGFRNLADLVECLEVWGKKGVRLVLLDLQVDTGTSVGRMLVSILGSVAEFERERISERTREVLRSRKARGLPVGSAPYGYKCTGQYGKRRLVPDPYTRALGARMVAWHDAGWGYYAILHHLWHNGITTRKGTPWTYGSVYRSVQAERLLQAKEQALAAQAAAHTHQASSSHGDDIE